MKLSQSLSTVRFLPMIAGKVKDVRLSSHDLILNLKRGSNHWYRNYPVLQRATVGVPSWILLRANVIDTVGLNDYVIARTPAPRLANRRMAHDRQPPAGYVECFRPNVKVKNGKVVALSRKVPLTSHEIRRSEAK